MALAKAKANSLEEDIIMALSNLERCKAWILNKPKVDEIRAKLALTEEKLLALGNAHPKRNDLMNTMQELLTHLNMLDSTEHSLTVNKLVMNEATSNLAFDTDLSVKTISDPLEKQSVFQALKSQLGSGSDLLKQTHHIA